MYKIIREPDAVSLEIEKRRFADICPGRCRFYICTIQEERDLHIILQIIEKNAIIIVYIKERETHMLVTIIKKRVISGQYHIKEKCAVIAIDSKET